jgi:hypothetical protein
VTTAYYIVLFLNFAIPAFVAVIGVLNKEIFEKVFQMNVWIQVLSCLVLFDACRRMFVIIRRDTVSGVNVRYLCFHIAVYLLYLAGIFYFYYTAVVEQTGQK